MGSDSDMPVMKEAITILEGFDIQVEVDIVSAHRTPEKLFDYGANAHKRGLKVIIAGAGGAAYSKAIGAQMPGGCQAGDRRHADAGKYD